MDIFSSIFINCDVRGYRTVVLGKIPGATLVYWCNNGSFKICWYFQRSFIQQLERVGYSTVYGL